MVAFIIGIVFCIVAILAVCFIREDKINYDKTRKILFVVFVVVCGVAGALCILGGIISMRTNV